MKIVNGLDLLKEPAGTIFQEYAPHYLKELQIFEGASSDYDFFARPFGATVISSINFPHDAEELKHFPGDQSDGVMLPAWTGRDGLYQLEQRWFLVYEEADRRKLVAQLLGEDDGSEEFLTFDFRQYQ